MLVGLNPALEHASRFNTFCSFFPVSCGGEVLYETLGGGAGAEYFSFEPNKGSLSAGGEVIVKVKFTPPAEEEKSEDDVQGIMNILLTRSYGRSRLIFGVF